MYSILENKHENDSQQGEDFEQLLPESANDRKPFSTPRTFWVVILVIWLFTIPISVGFGAWIVTPRGGWDAFALQHVQNYSPIQKEVDNKYHMVRYNGSFMHENSFRKEAGPEVDEAWASLGIDYRAVVVPVSEAAKSGLKHDQVQINPKYGGGFPANVEGLHHLHCLNLVRQSLFYNIDYYRTQGQGAFVNDDRIVKYHVSHCLDIVRQQLMCTVDTGMLGQIWWDQDYPRAFVDFNTEHKCKNFDAIRQWAEERQIPERVAGDFLKPPQEGDTIYPEIP